MPLVWSLPNPFRLTLQGKPKTKSFLPRCIECRVV